MANLKLATSTEFKIEKGVPLPAREEPVWPLRGMEIGDSFATTKARLISLRAAVVYEQRVNLGKKFTIRTLPTEIRCWRLA